MQQAPGCTAAEKTAASRGADRSILRALCQSSEQAERNFASQSVLIWSCACDSPRQSQRRFAGVKARSIASGPSALATSIASLWSISSDESPHISQSVCCISSGC